MVCWLVCGRGWYSSELLAVAVHTRCWWRFCPLLLVSGVVVDAGEWCRQGVGACQLVKQHGCVVVRWWLCGLVCVLVLACWLVRGRWWYSSELVTVAVHERC